VHTLRQAEPAQRPRVDAERLPGTKWRLPVPVVSRMFVTFIDGLVLGWPADHGDEQVLDVLDGFVDQLAVFAEPSGNSAAGPG